MNEQNADNESANEGELFRLFAENVQDYAIFLMDRQGHITKWPPAAERILGYSEEEIVGEAVEVLFTPEDRQNGEPQRELREAKSSGRGEDDRWHVRKDGSRFWASGVVTPLWSSRGELRGFAKTMRDLTEWKKADEARRESEARKAAVLETSLDGIITIDSADCIVEFNPAAERMFGYSRADVVGQKLADTLVPPRLREAHLRGMTHYLDTGEGPVLGKKVLLPATRADGSEFPIEVAIVRVPVEGDPLFTGYVRDLTERERYDRSQSAQLGITQTLAEAPSVKEAAPRILDVICECLGWEVGAFWIVDDQSQILRCMEVSHRTAAETEVLEEESRSRTFSKGMGIPGRVWQTAKPLSLSDIAPDDRFPRFTAAIEAGLRGAFAMPILIGGQVYGVLEFFGQSRPEPDKDLLKTLETIGGHIGQFVERKKSEAGLQQAHSELEIRVAQRTAELDLANRFLKALLESLHDGIAACDAEGNLTVLNQAANAFYGPPHEEASAPDWTNRHGLYHADGQTPLSPKEVPLLRAVRGERIRDAEIVIAPTQGPRRTLLVSFAERLTCESRRRIFAASSIDPQRRRGR